MSTIFDLLYREYCRACLVKMRRQLLIPLASDHGVEAPRVADDPAGPAIGATDGTTAPRRNKRQPSGSRAP
jgi:hypothetical protein